MTFACQNEIDQGTGIILHHLTTLIPHNRTRKMTHNIPAVHLWGCCGVARLLQKSRNQRCSVRMIIAFRFSYLATLIIRAG